MPYSWKYKCHMNLNCLYLALKFCIMYYCFCIAWWFWCLFIIISKAQSLKCANQNNFSCIVMSSLCVGQNIARHSHYWSHACEAALLYLGPIRRWSPHHDVTPPVPRPLVSASPLTPACSGPVWPSTWWSWSRERFALTLICDGY